MKKGKIGETNYYGKEYLFPKRASTLGNSIDQCRVSITFQNQNRIMMPQRNRIKKDYTTSYDKEYIFPNQKDSLG